ncbi:RNA-binding protein [Pseudanabaena biceps]|nr:RNA-binding protein [Pseudanabaena biceps]
MQDASIGSTWLKQLLVLMGYGNSEVFSSEVDIHQQDSPTNYWLEIKSDSLNEQQTQRLIGQDGAVLDALQYLASILLNNHTVAPTPQEIHNFYTIELNGYRQKRLADLQRLADNAVCQVRETKTDFIINHLSSPDRRHIHQLLEEFSDIETFSQGKEPNRHLVVKLV